MDEFVAELRHTDCKTAPDAFGASEKRARPPMHVRRSKEWRPPSPPYREAGVPLPRPAKVHSLRRPQRRPMDAGDERTRGRVCLAAAGQRGGGPPRTPDSKLEAAASASLEARTPVPKLPRPTARTPQPVPRSGAPRRHGARSSTRLGAPKRKQAAATWNGASHQPKRAKRSACKGPPAPVLVQMVPAREGSRLSSVLDRIRARLQQDKSAN